MKRTSPEFPIQRNVPLPHPRGGNRRYPFDQMKIGDSILVTDPSAGFPGYVSVWGKRHKRRLTLRTVREDGKTGFRVWRIAAGTAIPTVANTITTADLAISTGTNLRSTTFTNFSGSVAPTFTANDIVAVQLNAAATATVAVFSIQCQ